MNYFKFIAFIIVLMATQKMYAQNQRGFINTTYKTGSKFNTKSGLRGPQAGYGWQNNRGNLHEFELSVINYETQLINLRNITQIEADLGLRYQYSIFIAKKKLTGRIRPFIGLGISNYNYKITHRPLIPYLYRTSYTNIGLAGYVSPGVQYTTRKNLFLSLSVPVDVTTINLITNKVENPSWTAREQRNTEFELNANLFSDFKLRGGIGLLF